MNRNTENLINESAAPSTVDHDTPVDMSELIWHGDLLEPFQRVHIPGSPVFSQYYAVNQIGQVLALPRKLRNRHTEYIRPAMLLADNPVVDSAGYKHVCLQVNGHPRKLVKRHRLVMLTFDFNPSHDTLVVDHIDGNKLNNALSNLRWATYAENSLNYKQQREAGTAKLKGGYVKQEERAQIVKLFEDGLTVAEIAENMLRGYQTVLKVLREKGLVTERQQVLMESVTNGN